MQCWTISIPLCKSTSESYYLASFISLENVAEKPKILPTTNVYSGNLCYTFKKIKQKQNKTKYKYKKIHTNLDNSEDHVFIVMIRSLGTQCS